MTIFANAFATIKATDTTDVSATSQQVAVYDKIITAKMQTITNLLDGLVAANIEGWYQVEEAMMHEGEDFTLKVEDYRIEVIINLPARNEDVDMRTISSAMESYVGKWAPIRPANMELELVLRMGGNGLYVFETFGRTLEERKAAKGKA